MAGSIFPMLSQVARARELMTEEMERWRQPIGVLKSLISLAPFFFILLSFPIALFKIDQITLQFQQWDMIGGFDPKLSISSIFSD